MEGFLNKKVKEKSFGAGWLGDKAKSWKRQWFVLEDQVVTYYEDFDLSKDSPVQENGSFSIAGCEVLPVSHKTKKFIFCVKDPETNNTLMYVQADDAKIMGVWVGALTAAAKGEHKAPVIDYPYYYELLGLDPAVEHEPSVVNRAFRTAVAQAPVGRDGKAEGFKELQDAFNHIMAHLNDLEEAQLYRLAYYEAIVYKGGPGEGMGIVVQEEIDGRNLVKGLRDSLRIKSITGEVGEDGIEEGDQLVQLNNCDVSTMPLVRVAQRMNDFRIPPHSEVKLIFARKVLRTEDDVDESEYGEAQSLAFGAESVTRSEAHSAQQAQAQHYQAQPEVHLDYVDEGPAAAAEEEPRREPEYTRVPSQRSMSLQRGLSGQGLNASAAAPVVQQGAAEMQRTQSGRDWASASSRPLPPQPTQSSQSSPSSRNHSRSGSPSQQLSEPEAERRASSRPTSASRKEGIPPAPVEQPAQTSPGSVSSRHLPRPVSFSGSPQGASTRQPFSNAGPSQSQRPVTMGRQGIGAHGAFVNSPQPPVVPAAATASAGAGAAAGGRPLSVKMESINAKEYFKRNSLQMKSPAEIAEMKRDLDFCLKELQHASKRIEDLEFHNRNLEAEVARYKALYADSARHERLLETQLEQYLIHSTVTAEFMEESMNDMLYVSKQISENQPIPLSNQVITYLDELGLGENESELDGSKASQRNAIAATAAVDKSGLMLQKWAMTGDPITSKLSRFEEQVQRMGDSVHRPPGSPDRKQQEQAEAAAARIKQPQAYRQAGTAPAASAGNPAALKRANSSGLQAVAPVKKGPPALSTLPSNLGATAPVYSPSRATEPQAAAMFRQAAQAANARSATDPQAAQLVRQGSQRTATQQDVPHYMQQRSPMAKANSVGGKVLQQELQGPPLASTLLSRPFDMNR